MAMKKKDKPLRPNPLKGQLRGESSTKRVIKVVPKKPLTKPTLKNLTAPRGTGSGASAGSVKVLTKAENFMKKEKAAGRNPNKSDGKRTPLPGRNRSMTEQEKYKKSTGNQRLIDDTQYIKKNIARTKAELSKMVGNKNNKAKIGMTPPKKTPPTPPKSRFKGRPGLRGGMGFGGGGLFGSNKNK